MFLWSSQSVIFYYSSIYKHDFPMSPRLDPALFLLHFSRVFLNPPKRCSFLHPARSSAPKSARIEFLGPFLAHLRFWKVPQRSPKSIKLHNNTSKKQKPVVILGVPGADSRPRGRPKRPRPHFYWLFKDFSSILDGFLHDFDREFADRRHRQARNSMQRIGREPARSCKKSTTICQSLAKK